MARRTPRTPAASAHASAAATPSAAQAREAPASAVRALEAHLQRQGLKMTQQRKDLLRAALAHGEHFTAEELHARLRQEGRPVALATVYRGLSLLEAAGLLEGHDFHSGQRRYERRHEREHHDHMVCLDCRAVVEFEDEAIERLQEKAAAAQGFRIREHHLTLFVACETLLREGRCPRREGRAGPGAQA